MNALGLKWSSHLVLAGLSPSLDWQIVLAIDRCISHVKGRILRIVRPAALMITLILLGEKKLGENKALLS